MHPFVPRHPPEFRAGAHSWHWYAPRVAMGLFVAALLGLLWLLHRQDLEENRGHLIRDTLWVEQNVRFGLDRGLEQLRQLGHDVGEIGLEPRQFELRVKHLSSNGPGLLQVALLDGQGVLRASVPAPSPPGGRGEVWVRPQSESAYQLARTTGKPAYAPAHASVGDTEFEVFVPYYRGGRFAGTVVGIYGLKSILAGLVPWWLAEKHRVTVRDGDGHVLAAKSNVEAGRPELTYQVVLDPPGFGLLLHLESYGSSTKLARNVLVAVIVSLAGVVLLNLRALSRHVQRRLATEQALRAEHAFRKAMEDSLVTGMRAVDLSGRVVYVNPAFCKMVGYSAQELIGREAPQRYWPPEEREYIEAALRAARAPDAPRAGIELKLMRCGGEWFDALLYEAPLIDAEGRQAGWMGSLLDITERKRARERARQQEEKLAATARLVTMGEMASAIAHELNQPLSAIASYTTGCLNVLDAGEPPRSELKEALQKVAQQAQRAGRIIRRVYEFVRKSEPAKTAVRINAVVDEAVGFVDAEAHKRGVKIRSQLSQADPELHADRLMLQEVLLNLVRNGMDAMAATPPENRQILITSESNGASVIVCVADRGCGLTPEVQEKLFEPFFTTKPEGMGMGLNICRSIVELHRGRLWAEPNPGGGTVFSFSLPVEVQ